MKVCFAGAYPPEPGGASHQTYWAARGLAERGHRILVVTAAVGAVQGSLDERDTPMYQPRFPASGGYVQVMRAADADLARIARQAAGAAGCAVIVASAAEPYASAGQLAARRSGRPLLIWPSDAGLPSPPPVFGPDARELAPADIVRLDASEGSGVCGRRFDAGLPSIGCYGSDPADAEGTRTLLAALAMLQADGLSCNVMLVCDRAACAQLRSAAVEAGLAESLWLLPPLPHWTVPAFIRACTAVCVLDPAGVQLPAEVLACGTCLVLPEQMLACLSYGERLRDGVSTVIVPGPAHPATLASRLRPLISRPSAAAGIAAAGQLISRQFCGFSQFVDGWEARVRAIGVPALAHIRHIDGPEPAAEVPDMLAETSIAAADRACRGSRWLQFGLSLPSSAPAPSLYAAVKDAADEALSSGSAAEFFYMHKPPGMRLRFREASARPGELEHRLRERLSGWQRQGIITDWRPGVYEPEDHLFGGPVSMRSVHRVFTADSLAWLGYHSSADSCPGPAWAMSLLMIRALFDALRIVGWEDRDVWDRLRRQAGRGLGPAADASQTLSRLGALLRPAWSSPDALAEPLAGPARELAGVYRDVVLSEGKHWFNDYFNAGAALAGPREVAAFMIVFHWNRGRFPTARQALLTEALLSREPEAVR